MNITCPACNHQFVVPLEPIQLEEQHTKYALNDKAVQKILCTEAAKAAPLGYRMHRCIGCGLEFASPLKAPNAEWYGHAYAVLPLYPSARWEYGTTLGRMAPGQSVIDLGCGSGLYLQLCQNAGLRASGLDFATRAVQSCRASGLDVALLDLSASAPVENRQFDCLTAFHVLEHMDSPQGLFAYAARLARKGSRFYVSIPGQYRASRHYGERDFLDQPPHHMSRWTERALKEVPGSTGWRFLTVEHESAGYWVKLWEISRRTSLYARLTTKGWHFGLMDKVARGLTMPYAMWALVTKHKRLSGFSMLATYQLD